ETANACRRFGSPFLFRCLVRRRFYYPPDRDYGTTLFGNAGRFGLTGGFFLSSAISTSTAFSSCGSRPAITAAGDISTSMSGGTPTFSTTQPSSCVQIAKLGAVTVPP